MKEMDEIDARQIAEAGLKFVEKRKVPVAEMYMQIRHEWPLYKSIDNEQNCVPLSIYESPLYRLLEQYNRKPLLHDLFGRILFTRTSYLLKGIA